MTIYVKENLLSQCNLAKSHDMRFVHMAGITASIPVYERRNISDFLQTNKQDINPKKTLSNIDELTKKLFECAESKAGEKILKSLLNDDFVIEEYTETRHDTGPTESFYAGDAYRNLYGNFSVYQVYKARSNFEQLMLTPGFFKNVMSNNNDNGLKIIFLDLLKDLKLTSRDCVDFSEMDLSGCSFESAKLGHSKFTNTNLKGANFTKTKLIDCQGLTQNQLDTTYYDSALLSNNFSVYWNADIKEKFLKHLQALNDYAKKNIPINHQKYIAIDSLYHKYEPILKSPVNPTIQVKLEMLEDIKQYMNKNSYYRNYYFLIKEFFTSLAMLVLPYLAKSSHNYCKNGYFGIFTQPASSAKSGAYIKCINDNDKGLSLIASKN